MQNTSISISWTDWEIVRFNLRLILSLERSKFFQRKPKLTLSFLFIVSLKWKNLKFISILIFMRLKWNKIYWSIEIFRIIGHALIANSFPMMNNRWKRSVAKRKIVDDKCISITIDNWDDRTTQIYLRLLSASRTIITSNAYLLLYGSSIWPHKRLITN